MEIADELPMAQACPGDRWIAYLAEHQDSCPAPTGTLWHGAHLFQSVSTGPSWAMAPGLAPFCLYTWTGNAPPSQGAINWLHAFIDHAVESVAPDCRVVVPAASEIVEQSWRQLHAHVHEHVGFLPALPLDPTRAPRKVRVAVVDSVPSSYQPGSGNTGESPHGWAVGRLIRELSCPAPLDPASACVSVVSPHLALPLDASGEVDLQHGGFYGRVSDMALAVADAVNAWRLHNHGRAPSAADYQVRLLANLSVAWQPPGDLPAPGPGGSALPPPARAVYAALTHLTCWGGAAIVAAGNDLGGPGPNAGPLLPAEWETEPGPTPQACQSFEGQNYAAGLPFTLFPPPGSYYPLVYAAGAVRGDNRPIASTRPGGRPRLAALGAHVVAADRDSGGEIPTAVQSGSSMAAGVISGSAVTAWGYHPELTAAVLMERVFGAGAEVGQPADFCLGGQPCPYLPSHPRRRIRRVKLCSSIAAVCDAGGTRCPNPEPECPKPSPDIGPLPVPAEDVRAIINEVIADERGTHVAFTYDESLPPLSVCGHDGFQTNAFRYPASTCPFRQWGTQPAPLPLANPQPGGNPCPACWMSLSATAGGYHASVYVSIDPDYPYAVTGGTLKIDGYPEIDLGVLGTLEPGDEAKVVAIPIAATGSFDKATIDFRDAEIQIDGSYVPADIASSNELIVWTE